MNDASITVEVAYATSQIQIVETVKVPAGATAAHAITASGILNRFPDIDLAKQAVGIFGTRVRLTDRISDGDRIEIYRPLVADPKEMRRRRARKARASRS